jgi:hypothetical protein
MERFRFGEQEGPNGAKYTRNGWLAVWGGEGLELKTGRCSLEVAGPKGAVRAVVVMDKATAWKLGAALLKWAGADDDIIGVYSKKTGKIIPWAAL